MTRQSKLGNWGSFKADKCTGIGLRQKSSVLYNIEGSWEEACKHAGAIIDGYEFAHPARCVNTTFEMWGEFDVPDESCKPHWENFRSGGCAGVGLRRHTASLENIRDLPLEDACRKTPATINGVTLERPRHCRIERIDDDLTTVGEFDVPDTSCGPIYPE